MQHCAGPPPRWRKVAGGVASRPAHCLGPLVWEVPQRSTITSYSCLPSKMMGKKWICPSGLVWVSCRACGWGEVGGQATQIPSTTTPRLWTMACHVLPPWSRGGVRMCIKLLPATARVLNAWGSGAGGRGAP